jgi:divalent metal cation (Fe/Co/Zn/Cd) transporter
VVVLGEDIAALLGLALAFAFVSLAYITGDAIFDAIGSACIGVVLVTVSVLLSIRMRTLLVGQSADPEIQQVIDRVIDGQPDIDFVFNTITMQFGPDTMLAAKIKLRTGIDIDAAAATINHLERELKSRVPNLKWCFIEPDVAD